MTITFESRGLVKISQQVACRVPKGFQGNQDQKMLRFDIVISFDAGDRRAVYNEVIADVQKAFPDYELQVAMDTDFAEE